MYHKATSLEDSGSSAHEIEIPPFEINGEEIEIGPGGEPVHRNRRPFVRGPLDWDWLLQAYAAGRSALLVGLDILRKAGMAPAGEWVVANPTALSSYLSRSCYSRSLDRLEEAGLVETNRKDGAAVRVKVLASSGPPAD